MLKFAETFCTSSWSSSRSMSLQHLLGGVGIVDVDRVLGDPRDLARLGRDAGVGQGLGHVAVDGRIAGDLELVADALHVVGAGLQGQLHQLVFVDGVGGDEEQALALEHPGDAAGAAQFAVGELEDLADFAGGAVAVVGSTSQRMATPPEP